MILNNNICLIGTKNIWFVTTDGNLYFGNRDFNDTCARRFISNNGEEFTSDKIYAWGYQSDVIGKDDPPKEETAKWIKYRFDGPMYQCCGSMYATCSSCGKESFHLKKNLSEYCPNCGKKMVRGE